ncbi:hypothetical protein [Nostoc sp.]|uniref:hypothetical protein n=1 Tax=Nostoc sp. TaxID=1180 RepID=UPI002FF977C1
MRDLIKLTTSKVVRSRRFEYLTPACRLNHFSSLRFGIFPFVAIPPHDKACKYAIKMHNSLLSRLREAIGITDS